NHTHDERCGPAFDEGCESRFEVGITAGLHDDDLLPECAGSRKDVAFLLLVRQYSRIGRQIGDRWRVWNEFAQQTKPLAGKALAEKGHSRGVAPRPVQGGSKTVLHRIATVYEDDRNR